MAEKSIYEKIKQRIEDERKYGIRQSEKVGAPYYQPEASDSPAERRIRSRAQREYMDKNATGLPAYMDEGVFAPTIRAIQKIRAGEPIKDTEGDAGLMRGTKAAGEKAISEFRKNPTDGDYAKGGKVSSASKRADGCAQRGKTRGKMV